VSDDGERTAPAAAAGALTRFDHLGHVKRPEDLPANVAAEVAEIMARHTPNLRAFLLQDAPTVVGLLGAVCATYPFLGASFPWALFLIGSGSGLLGAWRSAPYREAARHLKAAGVPRRGRRAIFRRLRRVLGPFPGAPKDRPSAEWFVDRLAPSHDELGRPRDTALTPLRVASDLDRDTALAVTGSVRRTSGASAWMMGGISALFATLGVSAVVLLPEMWFAAALHFGFSGLSAWSAGRRRRTFHQVLEAAGLPREERRKVYRAFRDLEKDRETRRTLKKLPKEERPAWLAERLRELVSGATD
jgi:hypothetical protein